MKKRYIASLLILLLLAFTGGRLSPDARYPLSDSQLSSMVGGAFWGGVACGVAGATAATVGIAIVGAATAGTALPFAVIFAGSVGAHVAAVCALME